MSSGKPGLAVSLSHIERLSKPKQQDLLNMAIEAERAGVDQLVLSEHVALPAVVREHSGVRPDDQDPAFSFSAEEEYPEPLVTLGAFAAVTSSVRLSTNVLLATVRPPVLLAKMAATVDVLSQGRLDLGVGIGWLGEEFDALGIPRTRLGHRLDATIEICQSLWCGGPTSAETEILSIHDIVCSPTPIQSPIPIWFGGSASRFVARRIAQFGAGWSPMGNATVDDLKTGRRLIEEECDRIGRDVSNVGLRCSLPLAMNSIGNGDIYGTVTAAADLVDLGATVVQLPQLRHFIDRADEVPDLLRSAVATLKKAT